jgi:ComF family protein
MQWLRPIAAQLPSIFLQADCWLCDRRCDRGCNSSLCKSCQTRLNTDILPRQQQLQQQDLSKKLSTDAAPQVLAWASYRDSAKRLLTQLKYQNRPEIAEFLGQQLAQTWLRHSLPHCSIVPIPLHVDRQAERGYNQAGLIAHSFARFVGVRVLDNLLIRNKATTAQYGLSLSDRQQNLQDAFEINPRSTRHLIQQQPVVLIDDIYTTGATVRAASQILNQAGIAVWGVAVVARIQAWDRVQ